MRLIPASKYTVEQLTEAYNQTRIDYLVPMPMTPRRLAEYIRDYNVDLDASVVAVEGDEILGLCMLGVRGGKGWVTRLGVLPSARRQHAGQALVDSCLDQARKLKITEIWLEVIVGNTPAHNLFVNKGFKETGRLLILRRPPGIPPAVPHLPAYQRALTEVEKLQLLTADEMLKLATNDTSHHAWTNQHHTFANTGAMQGLLLKSATTRNSGWISFEESPLQLRRVIIGLLGGSWLETAYTLLHGLHSRFPMLDTVAENTPFDAPCLAAYYAHGYVASFARIEMMLELSPESGRKSKGKSS